MELQDDFGIPTENLVCQNTNPGPHCIDGVCVDASCDGVAQGSGIVGQGFGGECLFEQGTTVAPFADDSLFCWSLLRSTIHRLSLHLDSPRWALAP